MLLPGMNPYLTACCPLCQTRWPLFEVNEKAGGYSFGPTLLLFVLIFESDNWNLLDFFSGRAPLQSEYHIGCAFKKTNIFFPAHAALAVLQTDKLLLHFSAAVWTYLAAGTRTHDWGLFPKLNAQSFRYFFWRFAGLLRLL